MYLEGQIIEHRGESYRVKLRQYTSARLRIDIMTEDNISYAVLTTNIPEVELKEREILVKGWSENEGICQTARESDLFEDTGKRILIGRVEAQIWKIKEQYELPK